MRFDPASWAEVHDRSEARHLAFRRGLALCLDRCGPRIRPGDLWADVGSGTGHLTRALAERGTRAIGLDLDPGMARYARRRWARPFATAEAGSLPLEDSSCSGIVAISLLGCLPETADLAGFLGEAARVLEPGGTLCLTAMNRHSRLLAIGKLWSWPARLRGARYTAYDPTLLADRVRRSGFLLEEQIFYGHFLAAGRLVLPQAGTILRREVSSSPGSREPWARYLLLLARRA